MPSPWPIPIELTAEERAQLEAWERRRTSAGAGVVITDRARRGRWAEQQRDRARVGDRVGSVRKWRPASPITGLRG